MCGIAGIADFNQTDISRVVLENMANRISHRGPDGEGFYINKHIGLAHRRLSIIDLEGGAQPIYNTDKTVWISFNGEIFNYLELRDELEARGYKFYTNTDTEVIVHMYDEFGLGFLDYLNGQFAISLWDEKKQQLVLARDRVGIVPLFYTQEKNRLVFASEIKAILPALESSPSLNACTLKSIMTFWAPIGEMTAFDNITSLEPGTLLVFSEVGLLKKKWWDWQYNEAISTTNEDDLAEELFELLNDAVNIRLRSDVPVGGYLSGGLDSAILTQLIHSQDYSDLHTYSIGFQDSDFDETEFQQLMAEHLDTTHHYLSINNYDVSSNFEKIIWHTEVPLVRSAPAPMYLLSEMVHKNNFKVVLTGEGADEVLGGYDIFKEAKIRRFWARGGSDSWRSLLLSRLYPWLNLPGGKEQAYLNSFFGNGLMDPDDALYSHRLRMRTTSGAQMFLSEEFSEKCNLSVEDVLQASLPDHFYEMTDLQKSVYLEATLLLPGYILSSQGDRMLMSNSVEGRFPFLDHRLIKFASTLPDKVKIKCLNEKNLLKKMAQTRVPDKIINRFKQPYRAPDALSFVNNDACGFVDHLMSDTVVDKYGYFSGKKTNLLMKKVKRGDALGFKDNISFMTILSTQIWHDRFITTQ